MKIKHLLYRQHEHRADLAGEHALGDVGQFVLLSIFLAVWIGLASLGFIISSQNMKNAFCSVNLGQTTKRICVTYPCGFLE